MPSELVIAMPQSLSSQSNILALESKWHAALELRVRAGEMSQATSRTYRIGLTKFLDWCADRIAISADTIREWLASLREEGRAAAAINTWLAGVKAFFAWAAGSRLIPYNPAASLKGVKRASSRKHKREELTDGEMRRVLAMPSDSVPGKRDRAIMCLMAYTAARTIEVHRADLADLQTKSGRLVLNVRGKGHEDKDAVIVLAHPDAESAMYDWLAVRGDAAGPLFTSLSNRSRNGRLSLSAIRWLVKSYYKAAGVRGKNKTTHSLRHSAITSAIKHGAPLEKVQSAARHANISTTMIYWHESDRVENPAEQYIRYDNETH